MKPVIRTPQGWMLSFHPGERDILAQLVMGLVQIVAVLLPEDDDEFASIVGVPISPDEIADRDPALQRLFPSAYRDDAEAYAEFRRFTEADAARAKIDAAMAVWNDLSASGEVLIPVSHHESWLRTLTNIRLVLFERQDPELNDVAEWVGWILESLLS